jgi:hypothetical protein
MHHKQLNITMKGALEGVTKTFHKRYAFVDGKFSVVATPDECDNLSRFFDASYNCDITITMPGAPVVEVPPEQVPDPEPEVEVAMTTRQGKILEAIGAVDVEDWVNDVVPHPSIATLAGLLEDSTITKAEVVEVIENYMVAAEVPTEDALDEADEDEPESQEEAVVNEAQDDADEHEEQEEEEAAPENDQPDQKE